MDLSVSFHLSRSCCHGCHGCHGCRGWFFADETLKVITASVFTSSSSSTEKICLKNLQEEIFNARVSKTMGPAIPLQIRTFVAVMEFESLAYVLISETVLMFISIRRWRHLLLILLVEFLFKKRANPRLFFVYFRLFKQSLQFFNNKKWKISKQYPAPGFELTTFCLRVSSLNNSTSFLPLSSCVFQVLYFSIVHTKIPIGHRSISKCQINQPNPIFSTFINVKHK